MATYDAGVVTAYGAAVQGGYTGTYEDFCLQQAQYATLSADVTSIQGDIGDLSELETTAKSDLVSAINEAAQSGGGNVSSVNGQTGAVVLDAGDLEYDDEETYSSNTVGKALTDLKGDLNGKLDEPSTAGTSGQVLTSDGQGGQSWQTPQSGGSVSPYTSNPSSLGTASPGVSDDYARGDHVHPMPTAANVGAIAAPSSPATGAFLVWNGSAWVAQTLATWQGGNY